MNNEKLFITKTILILYNEKILEYIHVDFTKDEWENKTVSKIEAIVKEWCKSNGYSFETDNIEWELSY